MVVHFETCALILLEPGIVGAAETLTRWVETASGLGFIPTLTAAFFRPPPPPPSPSSVAMGVDPLLVPIEDGLIWVSSDPCR